VFDIGCAKGMIRFDGSSGNQGVGQLDAVGEGMLKVGMTLYGGGYVPIAFLRDGLVHQWHWLTEGQELDAIAAGRFTPGPMFTSATFAGYLAGGFAGAFIAAFAIFLPSFVPIAISGPLVPLCDGPDGRRHRAVGKSRAVRYRADQCGAASSFPDQPGVADWREGSLRDDGAASAFDLNV